MFPEFFRIRSRIRILMLRIEIFRLRTTDTSGGNVGLVKHVLSQPTAVTAQEDASL